VVEGFFTALVKTKDPGAVASYLADDFISHTPGIVGKQGMVDFAAQQAETQPNAGFVEIFHTIAKDDLVVKHYTYSNEPANGTELTIVDFFRVKDGKIFEYWDVVAPIEKQ
jgi:predicted SnoaL-like aldol condensation-catalyzing enzyme